MTPKFSTSQDALRVLIEGNKRFQSGLRSIESLTTPAQMRELAEKGQAPFAIVLTCSDSRVPAEFIFDCGLGDLFVIRVAGNVVAPSLLASIEFAATKFGTPIVVVMGHSQCGAVKAAVEAETKGGTPPSTNLAKLIAKIKPSVRTAIREGAPALGSKLEEAATWANVRRTVELLSRESPILKGLIEKKSLLAVGAVYDLHTGKVAFEDGVSHVNSPERHGLMSALAAGTKAAAKVGT